ncbi:TonB-dependent receptor [Pseudomonas sp. BF-B-25]|uniref:TonB-dependent receptor n=1 Tax=Pseudomonas sp. BF-B-25 TaxID=2832355 RepID=UPI001CBAEDC7|nr:TonB-dependent receptor [Pseudomonas sp. BF-B-25]
MSPRLTRQAPTPSRVLSLLTAAILMAGTAPLMAATATEQSSRKMGDYSFAIPQQSLVSALNAFTTVTGWQIGVSSELAQGVASPGVRGSLSPEKALDRLLVGTNLGYRKLGNNSIVLEKRSGSSTLNLDQVTISATRNEQSVNSVPSTVSVYTREDLDRNNVNTIKELVRYEPGVSVGGAGQRAGITGYNIRGIDGDRVLTQVDGVQVPDGFFNGPYAQTNRNYVDPEIVKRVEILRGPASVLYGSNAIGGAVSYYTLDPDDIIKPGKDVGARLKTGYSSADDSWLTSGTVAGRTGELVTYGTTIKQDKITGLRTGTGTCLTVAGSCRVIGAPSATDTLTPASDFPDPTVNSYSLFAQDLISWGNWTFAPGARYDYTELKPHITEEFLATADQSGNGTVSDESKTWHRLSPNFGTTYSFNDYYTWYGKYAEGFRTPTAKALYGRFENIAGGYRVAPNPDLEPEKSKSYETGLRGNFEQGSFDVAVFYNKYRDFINENAITPGYTETTFQSNNIKHATIKGAEVKGRLNLDAFGAPQGLYTQGSVAYAYGRNDDNGEPLNSVNPLTGVFGLGYDQDTYGGLLSWTLVKKKDRVDSTSFKTPDGTSTQFKTPGFGILDLSAFYKVTDDVTVSGGVYNLTDKKYWLWDDVRGYDSVGEASVTQPANLDRLTQPGRNFAVNLIWDI